MPSGSDQNQGIEVLLAALDAPVQAGRRRAPRMAGGQPPEHGAADDGLTHGDGRLDRFVGAA